MVAFDFNEESFLNHVFGLDVITATIHMNPSAVLVCKLLISTNLTFYTYLEESSYNANRTNFDIRQVLL